MKHGVAFRKFSRTSSHRNLMLRNLVTSLLEHEQLKTTLPKARDAARLAEKMITLGKRRTHAAAVQARAFCLQDSVVTKLFGPLAQRYRDRPGGYTRIHKFGNRRGDNAPHAVLELVDNPRDLRMALTARAVGWDLLTHQLKSGKLPNNSEPNEVIKSCLGGNEPSSLRPMTRENLLKVTKFGQVGEKIASMASDSTTWMRRLVAESIAYSDFRENLGDKNADDNFREDVSPPRVAAGQKPLAGSASLPQLRQAMETGGLRLSQGSLGRPPQSRQYVRKRKLGISDLQLI